MVLPHVRTLFQHWTKIFHRCGWILQQLVNCSVGNVETISPVRLTVDRDENHRMLLHDGAEKIADYGRIRPADGGWRDRNHRDYRVMFALVDASEKTGAARAERYKKPH